MFINTHVFINSSVVYKLWVGGRGGPPSPPPPSPPRLRSGTGSTDLRISCVTVTVLCGFSFTNHGSQITMFQNQMPAHQPNLQHVITHICTCSSWYITGVIIRIRFPFGNEKSYTRKILEITANTAEFAASA